MSAEQSIQRKLAAILVADVVGFSRLAGADEDRLLARLRALRSDLIDPIVSVHYGRMVKRTGDGAIVEFRSVVDALRCAIEVQTGMVERNAGLPPERRIEFRIGVHLGDVVEEVDGDLMGDGVNIAARLEAIAETGGISISEDAWRQVQGKVEADFADTGDQALKNIARAVRVFRVRLKAGRATSASAAAAPAPDRRSIAVLPFQNMSADIEQEHFCDGLVDDILTTLAKIAGLRVIARNSSFVFKGRPVDVREAGKQLGARYVLEGSVRKSGARIRITAQLIDAEDGAHLWAERYDRPIDDIFAIQDEITLVLATEMQVKLTEGEQARLRYTTTTNVAAWTHWVQGLSHYRQSLTRENAGAARACWEKALALDPGSATLNAMLGFIHVLDARFGWWDDREAAAAKARVHVDRALNLDPDNADAHIASGGLRWLQRRFDDAIADAKRAVELAPGSADVVELAGFFLTMAGSPREALELIKKAGALNPNYPPMYLGSLGHAHRLAGHVEEAIIAFKAYDARVPGAGFGLTDLVVLYQEAGRLDEAKETAARLLAARPQFTVGSWLKTQIIRDMARCEADAAALRAAGLPEG